MPQAGLSPSKLSQVLSNSNLHLILLPTEKCNFRCTYCYEDFLLGRMSKETIESIKLFIAYRIENGLDHLSISWFGGEPLLAKDIIIEISSFIKTLQSSKPNLIYQSGMTTNASLLTRKTLSELAEVGVVNYQVSFDGPKNVHDLSRKRADGAGTFETIWANMLSIRNSDEDVKVALRIHITPQTVTLIDELVTQINECLLPDPRFSIVFKAIQNFEGANDSLIQILPYSDVQTQIRRLEQKVKNFSSIEQEPDEYVCYAARANSFVIRADGSIAKCTVAFHDSNNRVGKIRSNGTLLLDQQKIRYWLRGVSSSNDAAMACPNYAPE